MNPDYNDDFNQRKSSSNPPSLSTPGSKGKVKEKAIKWPGVPGKTGPNRSAGVKRAKIHPTSEGL